MFLRINLLMAAFMLKSHREDKLQIGPPEPLGQLTSAPPPHPDVEAQSNNWANQRSPPMDAAVIQRQ